LKMVGLRYLQRHLLLAGSIAALSTSAFSTLAQAQQLALPRSERWLEVEYIQGDVRLLTPSNQRPAKQGDRLQQVDSGLSTAALSASTLALDSDIGVVQVSENSRLRVSDMATLADGARVTALRIERGQARLQIRRFNNPNSSFEVDTPAGTAAVRGTTFGVVVAPSGKTVIGTTSGAVEAQAQGVGVLVNPGFASIIVPGEPPSPPIPLDRTLQLQVRSSTQDGGRIRVTGQIDPANQLLVNNAPVTTRANGRFSILVPTLPRSRLALLTVQNPMGEQRDYRLILRRDGR
ncbi:MAG: FecR family protein, partial [Cyanobacteria bacterium P01_A01_bin.135]